MIEVFKTDINSPVKAGELMHHISREFPNYRVNFDLDDCDRILRIQSGNDFVNITRVIEIVTAFGHRVALLE